MTKTKGITQMTAKKHAFEGFAIRKQSRGLIFRQYVSAAPGVQGKGRLTERRARALAVAKARYRWLNLILDLPRNYYRGKLTKLTLRILVNEGFTITPAAKKA